MKRQSRSPRLNPELKPRYLRQALRVLKDHSSGKTARELVEFYDELLREIQLCLEIDGDSVVRWILISTRESVL